MHSIIQALIRYAYVRRHLTAPVAVWFTPEGRLYVKTRELIRIIDEEAFYDEQDRPFPFGSRALNKDLRRLGAVETRQRAFGRALYIDLHPQDIEDVLFAIGEIGDETLEEYINAQLD